MTQTVKKTLRDSAGMRWTALLLLALAMFCSYVFMDILSPIKDLMQETRGWDSAAFGRMQGAEVFLNVYVFFLIIAGIILDKMGVRFTAVLSGAVMLIGGIIKFYAVTDGFDATPLGQWFTNNLNWDGDIPIIGTILPFADGMPGSAKLAAIGFMLFGSGCEMAGITVSRGIVKWFKGRETALAMGSEMALARLGVATCMIFAPFFAKLGGEVHVDNAVKFGVVLLCIALIMFIVYFFMDKKLDSQTGEAEEKDDPFKISDLGKIFTSLGFWLVALLCVLYYSAIFPFQKYAVNMLQCNLTLNPADPSTYWGGSTEGFPISVTVVQYIIMLIVAICSFSSNFSKKKGMKYGLMCLAIVALVIYCYMGYMRGTAETIFAVFPLLAVAITPILGNYVDHKGKAASMLMLGSILLVVCHLTFAFILPEFKGNTVGGTVVAYVTILVLGASFSLVPAALWPSVPKLVDEKIIGSAYAAIFWIQNIGLGLFPTLIGIVLQKTNAEGTAAHELDYTWALVMLAILGIAALLISIYLKAVDKKKGYGLEEPNIKPEEKPAQA
ncbi:MAG: MFS transporter [Muribaculaceae bacterium]|nr:MFS transporter [Muribaculaceae bacterium]